MINLTDIKTNIFNPLGKIAEIYTSSNIPHFVGKTIIKPFTDDMQKDVNNIVLFIDDSNNIVSGQIGKYNYNKGLHVVSFTC